jgi:hypothetical protein
VGLWGENDDVETLRGRFGNARPDAIATTLGEALAQVKEKDRRAEVPTLG